jgi:hypothetical protein
MDLRKGKYDGSAESGGYFIGHKSSKTSLGKEVI